MTSVFCQSSGNSCRQWSVRTSVVVARPDDSCRSDVVVKAQVAVDDHAEGLQLRRDCPELGL